MIREVVKHPAVESIVLCEIDEVSQYTKRKKERRKIKERGILAIIICH